MAEEDENVVDGEATAEETMLPISELIPQVEKVLGERVQPKLPKNAKFDLSYLEVATRLASAGMNQEEIAFFLGTKATNIKRWKKQYPLFKKAIEDGKQIAKAYLIAQGLRAAAGYDYVERNVKVKQKIGKDGKIVTYYPEVSEFHKHQPPNGNLLAFMLMNLSRQLKEEVPWVSHHKVEVEDNRTVNIQIQGKVASEHIERLAGAFMPKEVVEATFENGKQQEVVKGAGDPKCLPSGNPTKRNRKRKVEDGPAREDGNG